MSDALSRLQRAVAEGLGPHHHVSGLCAVGPLEDDSLWGVLELAPGRVDAAPPRPARGTLRLSAQGLDFVLSGVEFDFRDPEVARHLKLEGDLEFVVRSVVLSLRRPSPETRALFERAEREARANPKARAFSALERVAQPSLIEFDERLAAGVPFVVTGALAGWPAARDFRGWLAARAAVSLGVLVDVPVTLGELWERAERVGDVRGYSHGCPLPEALGADFPRPRYALRLQLSGMQLWAGGSRAPGEPITTLHRDAAVGLLGHLHGTKRFTVFSPDQAEALYPYPAHDTYQHCWVAPHRPDLARYPKFAGARGVDFVLEPGDLLVQPTGWFHCVYAPEGPVASLSAFIL